MYDDTDILNRQNEVTANGTKLTTALMILGCRYRVFEDSKKYMNTDTNV